MRWDLIEKFDLPVKDGLLRGRKSYIGAEDFFDEHYPGHPVMPETLLIEMVAQASGVLLGMTDNFEKEVILAKIQYAKFPMPAEPPCRLDVEARIEEAREEGAWAQGTVKCNGETVADVRLLLVKMAGIPDARAGRVVFSEKFLSHHGLKK